MGARIDHDGMAKSLPHFPRVLLHESVHSVGL